MNTRGPMPRPSPALAPALALALAFALVAAGCAALEGEGEESLVVRNNDVQPLTAVISITQHVGELLVFGESMGLRVGEAREFALAMRPGAHTVSVTTSTSLQESLPIEVPERGDTKIEIAFRRGAATITTTS